MSKKFDPLRSREVFDEFHLKYLLEQDKARFMPTAVGNAATHGLTDIVTAWLVGLHQQAHTGLLKYREWFEDSIARNERISDHPSYMQALQSEAYGLCIWMLENRNHDLAYHTAIDCIEVAWASEWNNGRGATGAEKLDCIDDYLSNCLQCGEYDRGIKMYESVAGQKGVNPKRGLTTRELGYWLCRENLKDASAREFEIDISERVLKENLEGVWLGHGQTLRAASWLKIVYWHSGAIKSPLECILKAYDLMPHVKRPSFV